MRVLLVNTNERTGGAAVATDRLMDALNNNGVKAKMLVANKQTDTITVAELPHPWRQQMCFLWERLIIFLHLHGQKEHLFEIDIANLGSQCLWYAICAIDDHRIRVSAYFHYTRGLNTRGFDEVFALYPVDDRVAADDFDTR